MNKIVRKRAENFLNSITDNWDEDIKESLIDSYIKLDYYEIPKDEIENIMNNIINGVSSEVKKKVF